ncbi:MAG: DUF1592 domain-containing protein [Fuerstiella sp.]
MRNHKSQMCRWLLVSLLCGGIVPRLAADDPLTDASGHSITEFLRTYCAACHDAESKSGGLSLMEESLRSVPQHPEIWESVIRKLKTRQMPPPGEERPKEATYDLVLSELQQQLDLAAAVDPRPGRTDTFRRLTRTEYGNAIRDLLHLQIDAAALLPKDEVSHGFDNITVGELSPTLLNRYISAAQTISRLAVGASASPGVGDTIRLRPDITQEEHVAGLPLGTRGGVLIPYHFPADGEYNIRVRLMRDRNEHVEGLKREHQLEILLDRERVALLPIRPPKNATQHQTADAHLQARVRVTAGPHDLGVTFLKKPSSLIETKRQPFQAHFNFHRHPRQSPAVYEVTVTSESISAESPSDQSASDDPAASTSGRHGLLTCRPKTPDDGEACARQILSPLLRRAYRRPIHEEDLVQPLKFYRNASAIDGFDAGIESALSSILVSPQFLFRIERDPSGAVPGKPYHISDVELASRLSFFLWSSLPDDELLQLAEDGRLRDPRVMKAQVQRMLADERSSSLVTSFAGQWLYLRNLETLTPDLRLFPDFDHNLREAFRRETELFFESIVREDRSVLDLLRADYTFLNERLAKHYGIPHIYGSRFRRIRLPPDSQRGGLLRHGSILTVTSYATRTSPVIRGHWILENLIGAPPPPPPDDVPALKDNTVAASLSVRERLTAHRANPACASCHDLMDPIGFSLENFDAIGRWRETEAGQPVDASGGLPDGSEFSGVDGLEQGILGRPELFAGTLTEKLLTFGLGRGVSDLDAPAVRKIVRDAAADDYRFSSIVQGIVDSVPFQMRMPE